MNTTRLQVALRDVEPAVTRVIDVPASTTPPELHELVQAALGWPTSATSASARHAASSVPVSHTGHCPSPMMHAPASLD